jgi:hypothetical protein
LTFARPTVEETPPSDFEIEMIGALHASIFYLGVPTLLRSWIVASWTAFAFLERGIGLSTGLRTPMFR